MTGNVLSLAVAVRGLPHVAGGGGSRTVTDPAFWGSGGGWPDIMTLVHAIVHSMMSPDAGADPLDQFQPEDPRIFSVFIEFEIGPSDAAGAELFGLTVCSPQWLADHPRPKGFEFIQATLVVDAWDVDLVVRAVNDLCEQTSAPGWSPIAESLSRFMTWEFSDFRGA